MTSIRASSDATVVCIIASTGTVRLRALRNGGYAIRVAPDDQPATDMPLSPSQMRLLVKHAVELLREAA